MTVTFLGNWEEGSHHGRPQAWQGGWAPPPGNIVKCFVHWAEVKRSVDLLFIHYFHNFSSASGGFAPNPHPDSSLDPAGGLSSPDPLIFPSLEKILRAPVAVTESA